MGVQPQLLDVRNREDLEPAFAATNRQRAEGLIVGQHGLFQAYRKQIAALAAKYELPAIYRSKDSIDAGGLMAYGPSHPDQSYLDLLETHYYSGLRKAGIPEK